ncbi:MAG: hypothetical protein ACYC1K_02645 [Minisyncoccota bacterium]
MSRNWQRFMVFAIALAIAPFITACGTEVPPVGPDVKYCSDGSPAPGNDVSRCPATPVETVSVSSVNVSTSFVGVSYPMVQVTISASGLSTTGKPVTVAITVDGSPINGSLTIPEGSYRVCFIGTSSSGVKSDETCQTRSITWPKIVGRFVAATPTSEYVPSGLWAVAEETDSVRVNSDGTFSLPTLAALKDTAKVVVRGSNEVFPTLARVEKKYFGNYVQISSVRNWTISTGTYAGQTVALSLEKAFKPTSLQAFGFFQRGQKVGEGGAYRYLVGSYVSFPVKVAVYRGRSSISLSSVDEGRLWDRLNEMEQVTGFDLFVPSDTTSVNAAGGIRLLLNPGAGAAVDEWSKGDYVSGQVTLGLGTNGTFAAFDPTVADAKHEFLHASGPIGHTCQWASVMEQSCLRNMPYNPQPEDVANWHLMRLGRGLERKYDTRFSMAQMHQGERVFLLNLPENGVIVYGTGGFEW